MTKKINVGNYVLKTSQQPVHGEIVTFNNDEYYKISNYDSMAPFFMSIVSDSDLWMFISSNGALTAGRRNPNNALFPYYTDDQIYDSDEITGSKTIIIVNKHNASFLWEPFSSKYRGIYTIKRNIYKNITSNHLIFEESNIDLNVSFQYAWFNCDKFGFIKKSQIVNNNHEAVTINLLDGIQNILPADVDRKLQLEFSTLVDGYKKNELQIDTNLAIYRLSSIPTDKAEPSESLRANTVWSEGLKNPKILLSSKQLDEFRNGNSIKPEIDIKATRGAYFLQSQFELNSKQDKQWYIVADVNKDQAEFNSLSHFISSNNKISQQIENEILKDNEGLKIKIAQADGCQLTSDSQNVFRHFSNTLFNIMRGGIFSNGYLIDKNDFVLFIQKANKEIINKYKSKINKLPDQFNVNELINHVSNTDSDFEKLFFEYLPLTFSRRHGDPSRPWNQFSIDIKDEYGHKKLDYQGNWRDIFQNWEALALSYPEFIENMITRFVNASTADGYNPYRITRDGIDWEVIDPLEPCSYIGYWGDHQIIYLLKLLEISKKYHPGKIQSFLTKKIFTYANVPYKIKTYQEILRDPQNTIDFDTELNDSIQEKVLNIGEDGKLIQNKNGETYFVNLMEKLLVPLLVKLANFIPEAGIWMNTQRPEWNDANNALVGNGASMVTLYYLRQFVDFCIDSFEELSTEQINISEEVFEFFVKLNDGFDSFKGLLTDSISNENRKIFVDHICQAGSDYRINIYKNGFSSNQQPLKIKELLTFLQLGKKYIDHSIKANKRDDNLYHSYNLINLTVHNKLGVRHLYEMLEGQVAVLSSGFLSSEDSIHLLDALKKSKLYRKDQSSYILYPNRELPRFVEKNIIPKKQFDQSELLRELVEKNNRDIVIKDFSGDLHFCNKFRNARILKQSLIELKKIKQNISDKDIRIILDIYESIFDHQSFTGRSGTFYKYEGLGSIYWHMVSKLLYAIQDTLFLAVNSNVNDSIIDKLKTHYYDIRKGIGSHKNPDHYGAFPTDPYSHTPEHCGVQQPGMTGQVKEDIITRFGEFGLIVRDGKIRFNTVLLNKNEFLKKSQTFNYYDLNNKKQSISLEPNSLAFTICQVPVIYLIANEQKIIITMNDGTEKIIEGCEINSTLSKTIFQRKDKVIKVKVIINI